MSQRLDNHTLLAIYRKMALLKLNDEKVISVLKSGRLAFVYYSGRGQDVIPSAVSVCLNQDDYIVTIYRGIHDSLAKGVPLRELWAELGGKATGTCKGKGGPMHITHPKSGVMVTTGVVGSSMPIANGLAYASQLDKNGRVTVAYFGDGASNIGAFHESLNLASLWKLPVVFVCQNNRYGEHTKYVNATTAKQVSDRAAAYQMPGVTVDGNDPCAMYLAAKEAIDRARAGGGPTLIEAMTFRFNGHNLGDDDAYMDKGEKLEWIKKDPVPKFREQLIREGVVTEADLNKIEAEIRAEIEDAVEFAVASPYPDGGELRRDVFSSETMV